MQGARGTLAVCVLYTSCEQKLRSSKSKTMQYTLPSNAVQLYSLENCF